MWMFRLQDNAVIDVTRITTLSVFLQNAVLLVSDFYL